MASTTSLLIMIAFMTLLTSALALPITDTVQYICSNATLQSPEKITVDWEIQNGAAVLELSRSTITSPTFYTRNGTDQWHMTLSTQSTSADRIDVSLNLDTVPYLSIRGELSLVTSHGDTIATESLFNTFDRNHYGYASTRTMNIIFNEISRINTALHNGDLIVRCKLAILTDVETQECSSQRRRETRPEVHDGGLIDDFRNLYKNLNLSDVTILVGNETIEAHKTVLAARSPYFASIFSSEDTDNVTIENMQPEEVNGLLEFLYTDDVKDLDEIAYAMMRAADLYQLPKLKTLAESAIYSRLNEAHAAEILVFADTYHAEELKKHALKFIVDHLNGVMSSNGYRDIMADHKDLLFDIILAVANKNAGH